MEYLVKRGIDSVRLSYNLPYLYSDSICYLAANDQAYYLMDDTAFGHFQNDFPEKKTPQKRYLYYGGNSKIVSENLAKIYVNKITTYKKSVNDFQDIYISTYKEAADFLVYAWVKSPEHFLNIVQPDFSITGIASVFNEDDFH
ncbi:MAG: hypothetical protein HC906_14560 [Bacteroidales bacterium]|nr:hypothetical protein [Bacteroidales bacterium]